MNESRKVQHLTAEQINLLPEFARDWIHDLETQTDRTGQLAELRLLQEAFKAQELLIAELRAAQPAVPVEERTATCKCFPAAPYWVSEEDGCVHCDNCGVFRDDPNPFITAPIPEERTGTLKRK